MDEPQFWWENITGPQMFLDGLETRLQNGHSVILRHPASRLWMDQVRDLLHKRPSMIGVPLDSLTWDETDTCPNVLRWLLFRVNPALAPRCPDHPAQRAEFLRKEKVFANRVIWISAAENLFPLLRFASDFPVGSLKTVGAFVIEVPEDLKFHQVGHRIEEVSVWDSVRDSDAQLFASILAERIQTIPRTMRPYAGFAASELAKDNIELIPVLLRAVTFREDDPISALQVLWYRVADNQPLPGRDVLEQRLWQAQLHAAFPLIEMERRSICARLAEQIETAIHMEYFDHNLGAVTTFDQSTKGGVNISDLEIGTLAFLAQQYRLADRVTPLLDLQDDPIRSRILLLRDCRNLIAHYRVCSPEQMFRLFDEHDLYR